MSSSNTGKSMPWIDEYEPHEWVAVYEVPPPEHKALAKLLRKPPFVVYGAESEAVEIYWTYYGSAVSVFLFDLEQMAIDSDETLAVDLENTCWGPSEIGILTEEWRDHAAGMLVYSFYRGVTKDPPFLTVAVGNPRKRMPAGNIDGLPKAAVLAALFNASAPVGLGFLQHETNEPMTIEEAEEVLAEGDDHFKEDRELYLLNGYNPLFFDYVRGRPLKVDLSGDHLDTVSYNLKNGAGTAERAIEWLRRTGQVTSLELSQAQQEKLIENGFYILDHVDKGLRFRINGQEFSVGFANHAEALREAIRKAVNELPE